MRKAKNFLALATALSVAALGTVAAQVPPVGVIDENLLFGGPGDIVRVIDEATASAGTVDLIEKKPFAPTFTVSGSGSTGASLSFMIKPPSSGAAADPASLGSTATAKIEADAVVSESVHVNASTRLDMTNGLASYATASAYADVRPAELERFYLSGSFLWNAGASPTAKIEELFVDAAIDRSLFFRFGKQRVSWGLGYYYSPADVISLAAIDPENPGLSREGPYAVKVYAPFGLNLATLYATAPASGTDPASSSFAAKVDLVTGVFEIGIGAFYRPDLSVRPRAMLMFTGALGSFDLFGEFVAAWGNDRTIVRRASGGGLEAFHDTNSPIFQATAGLAWSYSLSGVFSLSLRAQGYYNGTGYLDSSILRESGLAALKASGAIASSDLRQSGMFYSAGNLSVSGLFDDALSFGAGALSNLSDPSLRLTPTLTWKTPDKVSLNVKGTVDFGPEKAEYASTRQASASLSLPISSDMSLSLNASLFFLGKDVKTGSIPATAGITFSSIAF